MPWRLAAAAYGPTLLFGVGEGAILPMLPLSARGAGASVALAALVAGLLGVGALLGNLPASVLTQRHGERRAIVAAGVMGALAMGLCGASAWLGAWGLPVLMGGALVVGLAQAVFNLARQSYLTDAVPVEYRARALSALGGVMRVGMFSGPLLAALAIHQAGVGAAYAVGTLALLLAAAAAARLPDLPSSAAAAAPGAPGAPTPAPGWRSTLRTHRQLLATLGLGVALLSAVRAARQAAVPLWADHLGLAPQVVSLVVGLAAALEMLVFYPAGHVMDRRGRRGVAVASLLLMGGALLLMPLAHSAAALMVVAAVVGVGNGLGSGLIMTLGADHSPAGGRAHFLGLWRLMSDIGGTCGPALLSALAALLTLGAGIAAIGALGLAAAVQLGYWIPRAGRPRQG